MSEAPTGVESGDPVRIACAARRDYLPHCATMLHSVLAHADDPVEVHCLTGTDVEAAEIGRLCNMAAAGGATLAAHGVSDSRIAALKTTETFPRAHWYRVLLAELLPNVNRVIYLDSDLIANESLAPLRDLDLGGRWLAAVTNVFPNPESAARHCAALGIDDPRRYFNTGVMVLDLAALRAADAPRRVIEFAAAHRGRLFLPEQDAMNAVLADRRLPLAPRWNCMNAVVRFPWSAEALGAEAVAEARRRPAIRHFEGSGSNKPWSPDADPQAQRLYWWHRDRTPWARGEVRAG